MLLKYFIRHKLATALLVIFLITKPSMSAWLTVQSVVLFDAAADGEWTTVVRLFLVLPLVYCAEQVVAYWARVVTAYLVAGSRRDLKSDMFSSILHTNLSTYWKSEPGDYMATFTNDVTILDERYFQAWINSIDYTITIVIVGGTFFSLNATLAAVIVAGGVICGLVPVLLTRYTSRKNREFIDQFSEFTRRIKELFGAFSTIKNFSVEDEMRARFEQANSLTERRKFEAEFALEFANSLSGTLAWFIRIAVLGVGLIMVSRGDVSFGLVLSAYAFANESLAMPLNWLINQVNAIVSIRPIVAKVKEYNREAAQEDRVRAGAVPPFEQVEFADVALNIGGTQVLDSINLTLHRGGKYLVVGKNGSGKSSLFALLKRATDDYTGRVMIGDTEVRTLPFSVLSTLTSYLAEDGMIFSTTVINNVALFRDVTEQQLRFAVDAAQLEIPLNRQVLDSGRNVSSGERRRIEIARALVTGSDILVFDEVISTLDIETAYEIEELALGLEDKTVVFISHNFSGKLIESYDAIIVMDSGKILDVGGHRDLLERCPLYAKLFDIRHGATADDSCSSVEATDRTGRLGMVGSA
jgi:ABC-type multidrug transport system fused ATPase/permease subunit